MESTATFIFVDREIEPIKVQFKTNEKVSQIIERIPNKISINLKDFDFLYNGKKFDQDATVAKIKSDRNAKDIEISIKSKSKIIKCPDCVCNNALIKIINYKLNFSECFRHPEHQEIKNFANYENCQRIDYKQIYCQKCQKMMSKSLEDFFKCYNCSKLVGAAVYFCKRCNTQHLEEKKGHTTKKYDEKYYYCLDHYNNFVSYCKRCKLNLCDKCTHNKKHNIQKLENIDIKPIKKNLEYIKSQTEDLKIIVDQIKLMLDGAVKIIEKYYLIAQDIVRKYEDYNKTLKNYQVLETVDYLNVSNKEIIDDLNNVINGNQSDNDWIKKCIILIGIYRGDRQFYTSKKTFHLFGEGEDEDEDEEEFVEENENSENEKQENILQTETKLKGENYEINSQNGNPEQKKTKKKKKKK